MPKFDNIQSQFDNELDATTAGLREISSSRDERRKNQKTSKTTQDIPRYSSSNDYSISSTNSEYIEENIEKSLTDIKNEFILNSGKNRIGRVSDNDMIINADSVSRYHAIVYIEKSKGFLQDLNTFNGTYLNYKRIDSKVEFNSGDQTKSDTSTGHIFKLNFIPFF